MPSTLTHMAVAYDPSRDQLLVHGGNPGTIESTARQYVLDDAWLSVDLERSEPPGRAYHSLSFDEHMGAAVLFGGQRFTDALDDTWLYSSGTWTSVETSTAPESRFRHATAYYPPDESVILFGGNGTVFGNGRPLDDTWRFREGSWEPVATTRSPSPRYRSSLAYDERSQRLVLYGGWDGSFLEDTWEYDGDWRPVEQAGLPGPLADHRLAYEPDLGGVVLYGGDQSSSVYLWSGSGWERLPETGPIARRGHTMVYDREQAALVVFGGESDGLERADTWRREGPSWSEVTPLGSRITGRSHHAVVWDAIDRQLFSFGGLTREGYSAEAWARQFRVDQRPAVVVELAWAHSNVPRERIASVEITVEARTARETTTVMPADVELMIRRGDASPQQLGGWVPVPSSPRDAGASPEMSSYVVSGEALFAMLQHFDEKVAVKLRPMEGSTASNPVAIELDRFEINLTYDLSN